MQEIKKEAEWLKRNGYTFEGEAKSGLEFQTVLLIVADTRKKHDSGYPYIRAFADAGKKLYDMGWHDHWCTMQDLEDIGTEKYQPINCDALNKNIIRIAPWGKSKKFYIKRDPLWTSSLMVYNDGGWQ